MTSASSFLHRPFRYLALGDSYTIGEDLPAQDSFPFQLAALLSAGGWRLAPPQVIAKTGWTTGELKEAIQQTADIRPPYDLVTLLIGVNNQYRGYAMDDYRREFRELLAFALSCSGDTGQLIVLSIPDWGVTPFGRSSGRDMEQLSAEIDAFNAINREEAAAAGAAYIDITPGSRMAGTDGRLLASDGLHPSALMYAQWAEALQREVEIWLS